MVRLPCTGSKFPKYRNIIIPKGFLNPNEVNIIEIPLKGGDLQPLIVQEGTDICNYLIDGFSVSGLIHQTNAVGNHQLPKLNRGLTECNYDKLYVETFKDFCEDEKSYGNCMASSSNAVPIYNPSINNSDPSEVNITCNLSPYCLFNYKKYLGAKKAIGWKFADNECVTPNNYENSPINNSYSYYSKCPPNCPNKSQENSQYLSQSRQTNEEQNSSIKYIDKEKNGDEEKLNQLGTKSKTLDELLLELKEAKDLKDKYKADYEEEIKRKMEEAQKIKENLKDFKKEPEKKSLPESKEVSPQFLNSPAMGQKNCSSNINEILLENIRECMKKSQNADKQVEDNLPSASTSKDETKKNCLSTLRYAEEFRSIIKEVNQTIERIIDTSKQCSFKDNCSKKTLNSIMDKNERTLTLDNLNLATTSSLAKSSVTNLPESNSNPSEKLKTINESRKSSLAKTDKVTNKENYIKENKSKEKVCEKPNLRNIESKNDIPEFNNISEYKIRPSSNAGSYKKSESGKKSTAIVTNKVSDNATATNTSSGTENKIKSNNLNSSNYFGPSSSGLSERNKSGTSSSSRSQSNYGVPIAQSAQVNRFVDNTFCVDSNNKENIIHKPKSVSFSPTISEKEIQNYYNTNVLEENKLQPTLVNNFPTTTAIVQSTNVPNSSNSARFANQNSFENAKWDSKTDLENLESENQDDFNDDIIWKSTLTDEIEEIINILNTTSRCPKN